MNDLNEKEKIITKKIKILKNNMIFGLENNNIKDVEIEMDSEENDNRMDDINNYVGKQFFSLKILKSNGILEEERIFIPVYSEIKKHIRKFVFQGMRETILLK
jgi:hypothetical protein